MAVLALDTTTAVLTLGITDFNTLERYQTWEIGREISQYLHQHLATFCSLSLGLIWSGSWLPKGREVLPGLGWGLSRGDC